MQRRIVISLVTASFWPGLASRLGAQITTTTIVGTVLDRTGATVPGAQVTATNTETHLARTAQTNNGGQYRIEFLPVGTYSVDVTAGLFYGSVSGNEWNSTSNFQPFAVRQQFNDVRR